MSDDLSRRNFLELLGAGVVLSVSPGLRRPL